MTVNKEELFNVAKERIEEFKIDRLSNLFGHLPIDIRCFYKCFPVGSERHNDLIELMKKFEMLEVEN